LDRRKGHSVDRSETISAILCRHQTHNIRRQNLLAVTPLSRGTEPRIANRPWTTIVRRFEMLIAVRPLPILAERWRSRGFGGFCANWNGEV
jgi:hypothetical protein